MVTGRIITTLPRMRETPIAHAFYGQIDDKKKIAGVERTGRGHIAVSRDARLVALEAVVPGVFCNRRRLYNVKEYKPASKREFCRLRGMRGS